MDTNTCIVKKDFDNFVHYCCNECGWTPLDVLLVAFKDYCKWFKNFNEEISIEDFQSFVNQSHSQIQGTIEKPIVIGLSIHKWVKFSKCTHCDNLITYFKDVIPFVYSNCQNDFCSEECLDASGFKDIHHDEDNNYCDDWQHQEFYF